MKDLRGINMIKGMSHEVITKNIQEMMKDGKPLKEAIAASLAHAHQSKIHNLHDPDQPEQGNIGGGDDNAKHGEAVYTQEDANDGLSDNVMDVAKDYELNEATRQAILAKKHKRVFR